jgi:Protein of unknown function (FYDLN_acid)
VAKSEFGTKRICPTTGKKFYDLNKNPVISPYTGEVVPIAPVAPPRWRSGVARAAPVPTAEAAPEPMEAGLLAINGGCQFDGLSRAIGMMSVCKKLAAKTRSDGQHLRQVGFFHRGWRKDQPRSRSNPEDQMLEPSAPGLGQSKLAQALRRQGAARHSLQRVVA